MIVNDDVFDTNFIQINRKYKLTVGLLNAERTEQMQLVLQGMIEIKNTTRCC